jgi:hypothetical protein
MERTRKVPKNGNSMLYRNYWEHPNILGAVLSHVNNARSGYKIRFMGGSTV